MSRDRAEQSWLYHFWLEAQSGEPVPYLVAEELFDQIIAWVEERKLQIGGGFRAPTEEEMQPDPQPFGSM